MISSLYRAKEMPDAPGFVQVGVDAEGLLLLHAAPGQEPLEGMEVVKNGSWTWDSLIDTHPMDAIKVLRCQYEKPDFAKGAAPVAAADIESPCGIAIAEEVPADAVIVSDSIPPHFWAGDE